VALVRASPLCFYCKTPVPFDWQLDHRTPTARTPRAHALANLCVACSGCNSAKGQMDAEEFARLLQLVAGFHPAAAVDVLRRLRAGGRRYQSGR
jgi:5-methylcytosine-specific restriction endonuclease McrA